VVHQGLVRGQNEAHVTLPIEPELPRLRATIAHHPSVVLQAPPGAGKTTLVPLALLDEPWLGGRGIVMLEPRRLATRAAAFRLAELIGEPVGRRIGYRMRMDSRVSTHTRLEVVTEGILTRRLQQDPTLDGVGLVIFDEFHERSLNADLGLALTLRTQLLLRDDLRILVMSATLDGAAVSTLLGNAPIVSSEGRSFPVETRYRQPRPGQRMEGVVVATILEALRGDEGDVLVFLPGAGEIRRVESLLAEHTLGPSVAIAPLFGLLPREEQDRAIRPSPPDMRKVVLATSIAETSLTIEGVRVVIDSGLSRVPRFSPRTGMTRLETVRVSRASADQRRGRAGRLSAGVCYRLWPEHELQHLLAQSPPEILGADLAPLALDLASAGVDDADELRWIDPPPSAALAQARELLRELEAIDENHAVTAHGERMAALPIHPRLAHMLLRAQAIGAGALACELAAVLGDRDLLRGDGSPPDADIALRVDALRADGGSRQHGPWFVDRDAARRARDEAARLARMLKLSLRPAQPFDRIGLLLACAYPDRVGQRRSESGQRYLLRNGRGAAFASPQALGNSAYIVAAELDDQRQESRIFIAAAIDEDDVRDAFHDQIVTEHVVEWNDETQRVVARDRERLGALVLRDAPAARVDPSEVHAALLAEIARRGVSELPWSDSARRLRERLAFLGSLGDTWPDVSDEALAISLDRWLGPLVTDLRRLDELSRVDFSAALLGLLTWDQRRALDRLAPTHVDVPSGSRIPIDYSDPGAPVLAVRIQEVFGLTETPRIADGRVPLTIHLLSPAHRPVQVTKDLAGFWRTSYFDVRKDLRGRYPKHDWPENPLEAKATRRARRPKNGG
jgi:ATP-dependent helicase HrpB